MPAFWKKKKGPGKKRSHGVISPSLWLFYLGLLSMSLTGVTFSKYSTVVRGTISVKVASSAMATFLDDTGEELAALRVYEGQSISESDIPAGSDSITTENSGVALMALDAEAVEDSGTEILICKKFLGWSLDGETVVDPMEIEVTEDLYFIAVYEITEKTVVKGTPSNAVKTPAVPPTEAPPPVTTPSVEPPAETDAVPGTETAPETVITAGTGTVPETGCTAGTETVPETETIPETAVGNENVIIASSSNATRKE